MPGALCLPGLRFAVDFVAVRLLAGSYMALFLLLIWLMFAC